MSEEMPSSDAASPVEEKDGSKVVVGEKEVIEGDVEQTEDPGEPTEPVELTVEERITQLLNESGGIKRKINGKERTFQTFDDMIKHVSLDLSADEKFKAAQKIQRDAEAQVAAYKKGNLADYLKNRYGDLSAKEAKEALLETIDLITEEEEIDPKEKELRRYRKMEEEIKRKQEEEAANKDKTAREEEIQKNAQKILSQVTEASKKYGLPDDELLMGEVFNELILAGENDIEMTAGEAVRIVRDRAISTSVNFLKHLDAEQIEKILGEDLMKDIRGRGVAAVKEANKAFDAPSKKDSNQPSKAKDTKEIKKVDLSGRGRYGRLFDKK